MREFPKRDLTNKRFGKLHVSNFHGYILNKKNIRIPYWNCNCDCGNTHLIKQNSLVSQQQLSCGCLLKEYQKTILPKIAADRMKKPTGVAAFNKVYNSYKQNAKHKDIEFYLSKDDFKQLIDKKCVYCGIESYSLTKSYAMHKKSNGEYRYNGVDRIDNNKGYTLDNIVTCCEICNKAKRDLSLSAFEEWIKRLINFRSQNAS